MQKNSAESHSNLSKAQENATKPEQFARITNNPKFSLTPQSIDMSFSSDNPIPGRKEPEQSISPLVEVKSYYERHNKKALGALPHDSFSYHSNACGTTHQISHGYHSKAEALSPSPSPNCSPNTPSQQWNFEPAINNTGAGLGQKYPPDNSFVQASLSGQLSNTQTTTGHSQYANLQNSTSLPEMIPSFGSEQQLQKLSCFESLNNIYARRIENIDAKAWGDKELKILTYQEWIGCLTKANESLIKNVEELERGVAEHLELLQKRVNSNCRHSQSNELMKCRKDIATLIKYIKRSPNYNKWDLSGLILETISTDSLLDMCEFDNEDPARDDLGNYNDTDTVQRNKLYANMKALAHEVAEKHDEVRELKRQVICLEDEIQKAQKKIQLKDDVIKELRSDLKCASNKNSCSQSFDLSHDMPPTNLESQRGASSSTEIHNTVTSQFDNSFQFDSLSHSEQEADEKLKLLGEEINELFELFQYNNLNKEKMESYFKRIKTSMEKLEAEKNAADNKLNCIRQQLIDLESDTAEGTNDCDSGFHSKCENDQAIKIIDEVRKRWSRLSESNSELVVTNQKLQVENSELISRFEAQKSLSQHNGNILKQIADVLYNVTGKAISYTETYNTEPHKENPFSEAILAIQKDFREKERHLVMNLEKRHKENAELLEIVRHEGKERQLDIDNTAATPASTSTQSQADSSSICLDTLNGVPNSSTTLTAQPSDTRSASPSLRLAD